MTKIATAYLSCILLASCCSASQPQEPQVVYKTRIVKDCTWVKKLSFASQDTADTKREIIGWADTVDANCPELKGKAP